MGLEPLKRQRRVLVHHGGKQITGTAGESGIYLTLAQDAANKDGVVGLTYHHCIITKTEWGSIKSKSLKAAKPSIALTLKQAHALRAALDDLFTEATKKELV